MSPNESSEPILPHSQGVEAAAPTSNALEIPKRTTPTWEMELLLSGALVFSMLQLPELLDTWLMRVMPLFSVGVNTALAIVGLYLRAGLFALCLAFIAHLAVRAYWVALIGVNSVFPGNPDWSKSWNSSIGKRVASEVWVPMEQRIEAADNVASVVFAMGIACVAMMLSLSTVIGIMVAFGVALTLIGGGKISSLNGFFLGSITAVSLLMAAPLLDQLLGKRLKQGSWLARLIARIYRLQLNAPGFAHVGAITSPIFLNVRLKTFSKFLIAITMITVLVVSVQSSPQRDKNRERFEQFLPLTAASSTLRPEHYRNQRKGLMRFQATATIESLELGEKALLLFVPLSVDRHRQRMLRDCPKLAALPRPARGSAEHLRCAALVLAPTLDGKAIDASGLSWMLDGHSGFEGLAWRVDNAQITPGKHEIRIKTFERKDAKAASDQIITFYR